MKGFLKSAFNFTADVVKEWQSTAAAILIGGISLAVLAVVPLGLLFVQCALAKVVLGSANVLSDRSRAADKAASENPAPTLG